MGMEFQRRGRFLWAAVLLAGLSGSGFLLLSWLRTPVEPVAQGGVPAPRGGAADPAAAKPTLPFQGWPRDDKGHVVRPDVALLLSAEMFGYMQPCGCSSPQYGGLDRRFNFLKSLKDRGWNVAAVDLGDLSQKFGPQTLLKYQYSMKALKALDYAAIGVGKNEMAMPLFEALAGHALNDKSPRVLAYNLQNKADKFVEMVGGTKCTEGAGPKVGIVGMVGPSVAGNVRDPDVKFDPVPQQLPKALKELEAQKAEVFVLLYQGTNDEAKACAQTFPRLQVILTVSPEDEPPEKPILVGKTLIINVGHKGRYVGLVGVYKNPKADAPFALHYQLVRLGPEYETPAGQEKDNPILALLEDYTREVHKGNYLGHYSKTRHPIQLVKEFSESTYVGSEKCKKCHAASFQIWKASPHAHAYATLTKVTKPSLRQFDGECVVCHVTGFGYQGGFQNEAKTPHLMDNGCENCHGPASLHVEFQKTNRTNAKLNALMNPYRIPPHADAATKKRLEGLLDLSCQKCHDIDNDVHWSIDKWKKGKIFHHEPGLRAAPPKP